jgi:hypothetical protein
VHCEQAIFTSLPSSVRGGGTGYRIVAASRGIRADQRRDITARSPSHGGLCDTSPAALAMACYPLSGGQYCVAYSTSAGAEHTGRGGQTVYTRAIVVSRADFRRFGCNPLNMVRALERAGHAAPDLAPAPMLEPLELTPVSGVRSDVVAAVLGSGARAALLSVVATLLDERPLIVVVDDAGLALAETVYLALPAALRMRTALACGLRYSSARGAHLNCISGDVARTREMLRGHPIAWVDLRQRPDSEPRPPVQGRDGQSALISPPTSVGGSEHRPPGRGDVPDPNVCSASPVPDGWLKLVADQWSRGQIVELASLTERLAEDASPAARTRISRIVLDTERFSSADASEALKIVRDYLDLAGDNDTEFELIEKLLIAGQQRLSAQMASAEPDRIRAIGAGLMEVAQQSPEATALLLPACRKLLGRAAALEPALTARWAALLMQQARPVTAACLEELLSEMAERLFESMGALSEAQLVALREALTEWQVLPDSPTGAARLNRLMGAIGARLAGFSQEAPA